MSISDIKKNFKKYCVHVYSSHGSENNAEKMIKETKTDISIVISLHCSLEQWTEYNRNNMNI
jgi:hypothetical protein